MITCEGCKRPIRWYHKTGFNSSWHKQCADSWQSGYDTRLQFDANMNNSIGLPTPIEIYWATQCVPDMEAYKTCILKIKNTATKLGLIEDGQ